MDDFEDDDPRFICPIPIGEMVGWLKCQGYIVLSGREADDHRAETSRLEVELKKYGIVKKVLKRAADRYVLGHDSRDILADVLVFIRKWRLDESK